MKESNETPIPPMPRREIPIEDQAEKWDLLDHTPLEDVPEEIRDIVRRRHEYQ